MRALFAGTTPGRDRVLGSAPHRGGMRVAIVTESYRPDVNGVSHSVQRVVEHLLARGHSPLVIAPEPDPATRRDTEPDDPCPVLRVPSVPLPGYPAFRIGMPSRRVEAAIAAHGADVVHLASPFALAAHGAFVAERLGVPSVAVYQTDVAGFAGFYRSGGGNSLGRAAVWRWLRRVHGRAERTLAPSSAATADLRAHGIGGVHLWPRGVDGVRFHPARRDEDVHAELAAGGELLVGYVGRLAPEKHLELLEPVTHLPGVRVVVVGAGPARRTLEQRLPGAHFTGELRGGELARMYASLDVFVHTGAHETFCQAVQEALASGVPVVAPNAGGPVDLVRHGGTGYLVEPGSGAAVAAAVTALADPVRRAEFGLAARRSVARRTWTAVGDALLDHYDAAIGGHGLVRAA
jgi:phosphatidylinositol alpha 1,6-mannosyltransferase